MTLAQVARWLADEPRAQTGNLSLIPGISGVQAREDVNTFPLQLFPSMLPLSLGENSAENKPKHG
jgi:hypothetical protein